MFLETRVQPISFFNPINQLMYSVHDNLLPENILKDVPEVIVNS